MKNTHIGSSAIANPGNVFVSESSFLDSPLNNKSLKIEGKKKKIK